MNDCKYIIFEDGLGCPIAFLFPAILNPANLAMALKNQIGHPVSAGFVSFHPYPAAHGESITLKLRSRDEDSRTIAEELGMEYP